MFTKIFVFALLTAYAASNKTNTIEKHDSIDGWWKDLQQSFQEYYEQSKRAFEDTLNEVKRRASHAIEVSKNKFSELKEGYNELRESNKTEENKNNTWKNHIEGLKLQSLETLKSINIKYEQLKEKTEKVIKSQQEIWQAKIKELLEDIRKFDEVEKEDK